MAVMPRWLYNFQGNIDGSYVIQATGALIMWSLVLVSKLVTTT
jgi:hypothetical protein